MNRNDSMALLQVLFQLDVSFQSWFISSFPGTRVFCCSVILHTNHHVAQGKSLQHLKPLKRRFQLTVDFTVNWIYSILKKVQGSIETTIALFFHTHEYIGNWGKWHTRICGTRWTRGSRRETSNRMWTRPSLISSSNRQPTNTLATARWGQRGMTSKWLSSAWWDLGGYRSSHMGWELMTTRRTSNNTKTSSSWCSPSSSWWGKWYDWLRYRTSTWHKGYHGLQKNTKHASKLKGVTTAKPTIEYLWECIMRTCKPKYIVYLQQNHIQRIFEWSDSKTFLSFLWTRLHGPRPSLTQGKKKKILYPTWIPNHM